MKNNIIFPFTVVLALSGQYVQAQGSDIPAISRVTDSIYMIATQGAGNIAVFHASDGFILVDDQFANTTEKIQAQLKNIADKPVRFVINTHWHFDHSDGNENFGGSGSIIVAQENSRKRMTQEQLIELFNYRQRAYQKDGLPEITFTESIRFHIDNEEIDVVHFKNAHTDGDAVIFFKTSNVAHTGDIFITYGLPFIDVPNGGTIDGVIEAIERIVAMVNENTRIIPGHGGISSRADLIKYNDMLKTVRNRMAEQIQKGVKLEDLDEAAILGDFTSPFGNKAFLRIVYRSLASN